jgi:hypothetical protein
MAKNMKRIHKVTIERMLDTDPDTSYLGEYANKPTSEFSIDRAHDLDCICQSYNRPTGEGLRILESAQQYLMDRYNEVNDACHAKGEQNADDIDTLAWLDDGDTFITDFLNGHEDFCQKACGPCGRNEYQYFNPSFNYISSNGKLKDLTPNEVIQYTREDYKRMEALNSGEWYYIGIRAEAQVTFTSSVMQKVSSGGIWGVESDSSSSDHFPELEAEELAELSNQLHAAGFSKRVIAAAFKNVERKES